MRHHYRGHKMSIWLSLIPQLQKTGQRGSFPSHNSLTLEGPAWGVVRNVSSASTAASGASDRAVGTTCMTLAESQRVLYQQNDTLVRLETASRYAYSYAVGITAGLGGILFLLNAVLLGCVCRRRAAAGGGAAAAKESAAAAATSPTSLRTPVNSRSTGSVDFFQGGSLSGGTPQHQMVATAAADSSGGHVHHLAAGPPVHASSSSLPRAARGGQRTLLVQPPQQRPPGGGILRSSYVPAPRPDPGDSGSLSRCGSSLSSTPTPAARSSNSSSSSSTATVRNKSGGNRGSLVLHQHHHHAHQHRGHDDDGLHLPELAPPAQFDQPPSPPRSPPAQTVLINTTPQPIIRGSNGHLLNH